MKWPLYEQLISFLKWVHGPETLENVSAIMPFYPAIIYSIFMGFIICIILDKFLIKRINFWDQFKNINFEDIKNKTDDFWENTSKEEL
tara:strand:- start:1802 stop:2065 length:264 start_codon:yes stop_codon:yes gene_type:complete